MQKTRDFSGVTNRLSHFIADCSYDDIPLEVRQKAKGALLDWLGAAIGGTRQPGVNLLLSVILEMGGNKEATILGTGNKTNVLFAALVNGMASHSLDFDDTHMPTLCHCSSALLPALIAMAECHGKSGKELLSAYVVGFETQVRIGLAAGRSHYERGWHATSTLGRFGAAIGVAKLLSLDIDGISRAMGLAATQAAGLRETFGTMCKPFHPGKAAMDGVMSALLSSRGFSAPVAILEGKAGFLNVLSDSPKPEAAMNELGKRYFFLENSYKPYASCRLTHPVIDSVKQLRVDIAPQDVVSIDLFLGPLCLDAAGIKTPRTGLEAKFSVFHCAALALVQGDASAAHFNDDQVMDPLLVDLREKVRVTPVEGMKDGEARVVVTTKDGRTLEAHVSAPKGDPVNPMSFDDLVEKFKLLSGTVLSGEKVNRIVEMVEGMDDVEDVGQLVRYCHV